MRESNYSGALEAARSALRDVEALAGRVVRQPSLALLAEAERVQRRLQSAVEAQTAALEDPAPAEITVRDARARLLAMAPAVAEAHNSVARWIPALQGGTLSH
jgi:hypothetical protein